MAGEDDRNDDREDERDDPSAAAALEASSAWAPDGLMGSAWEDTFGVEGVVSASEVASVNAVSRVPEVATESLDLARASLEWASLWLLSLSEPWWPRTRGEGLPLESLGDDDPLSKAFCWAEGPARPKDPSWGLRLGAEACPPYWAADLPRPMGGGVDAEGPFDSTVLRYLALH